MYAARMMQSIDLFLLKRLIDEEKGLFGTIIFFWIQTAIEYVFINKNWMIYNEIRVVSNAKYFEVRDGESGDCFGIEVVFLLFVLCRLRKIRVQRSTLALLS